MCGSMILSCEGSKVSLPTLVKLLDLLYEKSFTFNCTVLVALALALDAFEM